MKVFIYSGIPGSGKSTIIARDHSGALVCSADHYFERDGVYRFDPSKLGDAHAQCLRKFVDALQTYHGRANMTDADREIVVDNTNTTVTEIAPYAALALAYGYELQIVTLECDPFVAHARNVHGVPLATIERMSDALDRRELMPWWPSAVIFTDGGEA